MYHRMLLLFLSISNLTRADRAGDVEELSDAGAGTRSPRVGTIGPMERVVASLFT